MLDRFFTSRKIKIVLLLILFFSVCVAIFSFVTPLQRKNQAISQRGKQTITETTSLALAIDYYNAPEMLALSRMPSESPFYKSLCGLLARVKETFGYQKVYLLYRGIGGRLGYLADGDYRSNTKPGIDYQPVGAPYPAARYPASCSKAAESLFEGKSATAYSALSLEENSPKSLVVSYLPLKALSGQVIAVLGVDAAFTPGDFGSIGFLNLEASAAISLAVFVVSLLLLMICLDRSKNRNKNEDKKSRKKENGILVDPLSDVDPKDYLE